MNICTFDIEEWYIYELYPKGGSTYYMPLLEKQLDCLLEVLERRQIKATFFCLGIIARNNPDIIKKISDECHEIGSHSNIHIPVNCMTPSSFRQDLRQSVDSLEQIIGKKVTMFRAPEFSIDEKTKWAFETLIEFGIEFDSSVQLARTLWHNENKTPGQTPVIIELPGGTIKELPLNYANFMCQKIVFSGGGYFRLIPYHLIKYMINRSQYNMTYFHIRDFDAEQKKVISAKYFRSYYGIKSAFSKFCRLIDDYDFISIGEAARLIDWTKVIQISFKNQ